MQEIILINNIKIYRFSSLESTNRTAMEVNDFEHLSVVAADTQTSGRGRLGRSFYSYDGGLYMSVLLDPARIGELSLNYLTPAAALAVLGALEAVGIDGLSIKWVNDILLGGRKVCGILTEAKTADSAIERIVVGIGINLSEHGGEFPPEIRDRAGDIRFCGDKLSLASDIAKRLGEYLTADARSIVAEYAENLAFVGENAYFTDLSAPAEKLCGRVLGVTDECHLKIELPSGEIKILSSGEML